MFLCSSAAGRVSARRPIYFLCFAKESSQRKATPPSASLRFAAGNLRCSQPLGVAQTRPAGSNSARPLIQRLLRSSAQPEGDRGIHAPSLRSARVVSLSCSCFRFGAGAVKSFKSEVKWTISSPLLFTSDRYQYVAHPSTQPIFASLPRWAVHIAAACLTRDKRLMVRARSCSAVFNCF